MSATDCSLRTSLRSRRLATPNVSSKRAPLQSPSQDFTPLPSMDERLAFLRPSRELLEYYRKKIADFDEEHEDLVKRLERYRETYDEQHKLQWEVHQREEEVAELQKALSDMQVFLFQEREQVLRLCSENDRLKIRELEDRKKIQHLLALVGPDLGEVTYFHKEPPHKVTVLQRPAKPRESQERNEPSTTDAKRNASKPAAKGEKQESSERYQRDNQALLLQVEALQAQLEEQTRLSKEQVEALLEDRRIHMEEAQVQHQRDKDKIKTVTDKLQKTQNLLYESTRDFLQLKLDARASEKAWIAEKDSLLRKLDRALQQHSSKQPGRDNKQRHAKEMLPADDGACKPHSKQIKVTLNMGPDQDLAILHEIRQGNRLTHKIQGELKSLKAKIYGLENELRLV
ncbi:coiled-coil domain-containing protein 77 isoform X2 [Pogoniulus pusillus]|uniref:coiled-coil domain-containing protein 77 isoform X2 n=1 Tax=Pogoniulus pusillus TaxID=488313 RepID=UPI0030B97320